MLSQYATKLLMFYFYLYARPFHIHVDVLKESDFKIDFSLVSV